MSTSTVYRLYGRLQRLWHSLEDGHKKRAKAGARFVFVGAVAGYLAYQLTRIGWGAVLQELPTSPWFYLLFLFQYASLPLVESVVYRFLWPSIGWRSLPALVKKRFFNREVMGYSGEVYFFTWARKRTGGASREVAATIRDVNILSALASTLVAAILLIFFLSQGQIRLLSLLESIGGSKTALAVVGVGAVALGWHFRKYLYALPVAQSALICALYGGRLVLGQVVQIGMWHIVMPEVALGTWFTFAAISIMISRLPFLPSQDLVFMGTAMALTTALRVPTAGVTAMLLTTSVLDKVINVSLVTAFTLASKKNPDPARAEGDGAFAPVEEDDDQLVSLPVDAARLGGATELVG